MTIESSCPRRDPELALVIASKCAVPLYKMRKIDLIKSIDSQDLRSFPAIQMDEINPARAISTTQPLPRSGTRSQLAKVWIS
jgi:hypothetical protein